MFSIATLTLVLCLGTVSQAANKEKTADKKGARTAASVNGYKGEKAMALYMAMEVQRLLNPSAITEYPHSSAEYRTNTLEIASKLSCLVRFTYKSERTEYECEYLN